jgi:hypothetical protein
MLFSCLFKSDGSRSEKIAWVDGNANDLERVKKELFVT